jgi:hypothetical protein
MKKFHPLQFSIVSFLMMASFSACFYGTSSSPTYIVDEARQKENVYYVPSATNTQMLSNKNDFSFSVLRNSGSKNLGTEIQVSYLPANHIGIIGSYASAHNINYMDFQNAEFGAGYVTALKNGWHFETYGGFDLGTILNNHYTGISNIRYTSFFIQPALVASNQNKTVQFGIVSKFSSVNFNANTTFTKDREPFSTKNANYLFDNPTHLMWQPSLMLRVGWKNFQFNTSYSHATDISKPDLYIAPDNFSIGVSLRLNFSNMSN